MQSQNPCNVCGNTNLNLIDGFYYCVECGTQDATARETVIELTTLADGTFAQMFKKKIHVQEDKVEMTGEWYKWHTFNFVLAGLADDMIKLGAKPTFKIKLLWVWTRYIKKFQNKEELGLTKDMEEINATMRLEEEYNEKEKNDKKENTTQPKKYLNVKDCAYRRINYITPMLIYTMIYVALNLDKSDIQLSHLTTFFKEKRINVYDIFKYIPKDIDCQKIPNWQTYLQCHVARIVFTTCRIRNLALTLFKDLNLGYPVNPDIRKLIDNYTTELCLPEDFKQIVYSLVYEYPCEFLNVNQKANLKQVPDYEGVTMSYILVALKMCFGLDDEYELRLSDVVDRINQQENHLKCYQSGFMDTGRIFSFREWLNYLQFRRKILLQNCMLTETEHYSDIDDYMYIEYVGKDYARSQKMLLEDEITLNILNKIPQDKLDVIPKTLFEPSLTPMSSYSKVIGEHHQECDVRLLICEDFTKYSLKYICEDFNLLDEHENILKGVEKSNKIQTGGDIRTNFADKSDYSMVFIKNCENKNWMQTNPPSTDHVTISNKNGKDSDSDLGYDSNNEHSSDKDMSTASVKTTYPPHKDRDVKLETIQEEDENVNIFDDDFAEIYYKEEVDVAVNEDLDAEPEEPPPACNNDDLVFSDDEELNFNNSLEFNPNTFNRERAIKDLILAACKQYKIPIPQEYRPDKAPKRKLFRDEAGVSNERKKIRKVVPGKAKQEVQNLIDMYYESVQRDIINNITEQMQEAIRNANATINDSNNILDSNINDIDLDLNGAQVHEDVLNDSQNITQNETELDQTAVEITENIESTLFDEKSDGEADLDEIMPKNDPKFDEKVFDIKQLYINFQEEIEGNQEDVIVEIENEPDIKEMLEQKVKESPKKVLADEFDSEDDLPLTLIKEEKLFQTELKEKMSENRDKLIKNDKIRKYNYWLRHYKYLTLVKDAQQLFDNEAKESLPKNFKFILSECASIINCSTFQMYKCMQCLEISIISRSKSM